MHDSQTLSKVPFVRTLLEKEITVFSRISSTSFLNSDYMLTKFAEETLKKMILNSDYVRRTITSFLQASTQASIFITG